MNDTQFLLFLYSLIMSAPHDHEEPYCTDPDELVPWVSPYATLSAAAELVFVKSKLFTDMERGFRKEGLPLGWDHLSAQQKFHKLYVANRRGIGIEIGSATRLLLDGEAGKMGMVRCGDMNFSPLDEPPLPNSLFYFCIVLGAVLTVAAFASLLQVARLFVLSIAEHTTIGPKPRPSFCRRLCRLLMYIPAAAFFIMLIAAGLDLLGRPPSAFAVPLVASGPDLSRAIVVTEANSVDNRIAKYEPGLIDHLTTVTDESERMTLLMSARDRMVAKFSRQEPKDDTSPDEPLPARGANSTQKRKGPITSFMAFDCLSDETEYQALSLLEPRSCQVAPTMFKPPTKVQIQGLEEALYYEVHARVCTLTIDQTATRCGYDGIVYSIRTILKDQLIFLHPNQCRHVLATRELNYDGHLITMPAEDTEVSAEWYSHGYLDSNDKCHATSFTYAVRGENQEFINSYITIHAKLKISDLYGSHNPHTGNLVFSNGLSAPYARESTLDDYVGTIVWKVTAPVCQDLLSEMYHGDAMLHKHRKNRGAGLEVDDILVIKNEEKQLYGAFTIEGHGRICDRVVATTQLSGISILLLNDNVPRIDLSSRPQRGQQLRHASSNNAYLHITAAMHWGKSLTEVIMKFCRLERQWLSILTSMVASENHYAAVSLYGQGYSIIRAGSVAYVGECPHVEVKIRNAQNCTQEIPVWYRDKAAFVDPITRNLVSMPTTIACDPVNPVSYRIEGVWVCMNPTMHTCLPPDELQPRSDQLTKDIQYAFHRGHGKGVYTEKMMQDHWNHIHELNARAPAVAAAGAVFSQHYMRVAGGDPLKVSSWNEGLVPASTIKKISDTVASHVSFLWPVLGEYTGKFIFLMFLCTLAFSAMLMIFRLIVGYKQFGCSPILLWYCCHASTLFVLLPLRKLSGIVDLFPEIKPHKVTKKQTLEAVTQGMPEWMRRRVFRVTPREEDEVYQTCWTRVTTANEDTDTECLIHMASAREKAQGVLNRNSTNSGHQQAGAVANDYADMRHGPASRAQAAPSAELSQAQQPLLQLSQPRPSGTKLTKILLEEPALNYPTIESQERAAQITVDRSRFVLPARQPTAPPAPLADLAGQQPPYHVPPYPTDRLLPLVPISSGRNDSQDTASIQAQRGARDDEEYHSYGEDEGTPTSAGASAGATALDTSTGATGEASPSKSPEKRKVRRSPRVRPDPPTSGECDTRRPHTSSS